MHRDLKDPFYKTKDCTSPKRGVNYPLHPPQSLIEPPSPFLTQKGPPLKNKNLGPK